MNDEGRHWWLGYASPKYRPPLLKTSTSIVLVHRMSDDEMLSYREAASLVRDHAEFGRLARCVELNRNELLAAVIDAGADFFEARSLPHDRMDELQTDFGRLLLNILSMFKSFLDHTETFFTRVYGDDCRASR